MGVLTDDQKKELEVQIGKATLEKEELKQDSGNADGATTEPSEGN